MSSHNTMTIEDVIATLDPQYRLSPLLKLRGHIAYRAAKLAGQYLVSMVKRVYDNKSAHGLEHIDTFNEMFEELRSVDIENHLLESAGMEVQKDMFTTLRELVLYGNKLNFDMQDLVDEGGTKRNKAGFKVRGVFFTEGEQEDSWHNSVGLLADPKDDFDTETYAEYAAKIDNPDWRLTEAEWIAAQAQDDNIWKTYGADIVNLLMSFGSDEGTFDELSERSQIAAIENMRGKIGRCIESAMQSIKYSKLDRAGKIAEASKLKGIINSWDGEFCKMLDSSRYANFAEFMYNYMPAREDSGVRNAPVSRRITARTESKPFNGRVDDLTARSVNNDDDDMVTPEDRQAAHVTALAAEAAAKDAERVRLDQQRQSKRPGLNDLADLIEQQKLDEANDDASAQHEYNVLGAEEGRFE